MHDRWKQAIDAVKPGDAKSATGVSPANSSPTAIVNISDQARAQAAATTFDPKKIYDTPTMESTYHFVRKSNVISDLDEQSQQRKLDRARESVKLSDSDILSDTIDILKDHKDKNKVKNSDLRDLAASIGINPELLKSIVDSDADGNISSGELAQSVKSIVAEDDQKHASDPQPK